MSNKNYTVIVPAAGIGSRMNASVPKQYLQIQGQTILETTLLRLLEHANIEQVVVVLHTEDEFFNTLPISENENIHAVTGGKERVDSVLAGLEYCVSHLSLTNEFVLIHDAARPCFDHSDIANLIKSKTAAILATPCADTLKKASQTSRTTIESTVDRSNIWQALTPQFSRLHTLIDAIKQCPHPDKITDEASALEMAGQPVTLVEGSSCNIKITRPSDLALAAFYLNEIYKEKG